MAEEEARAPKSKSKGPRWAASDPRKRSDKILEAQAAELIKRAETKQKRAKAVAALSASTRQSAPVSKLSTTESSSSAKDPKTSPMSNGPTLSLRSSKRPTTSLDLHQAGKWGVEDVGKWLGSVGLRKYVGLFEEHAIDGEVLLEVGKDDLDYLGVKALGHRKILMRGITQLRRACGMEQDEKEEAVEDRATKTEASSSTEPAKVVHWSEAVSQRPNAGSGNAKDDVLDEAAEHAAFQAAVLEWRRGQKQTPASTTTATATEESTADADAWVNPFAKKKEDDFPKASCYHCLRLFVQVPNRFIKSEEGHLFCSSTCSQNYQDSLQKKSSPPPQTKKPPTPPPSNPSTNPPPSEPSTPSPTPQDPIMDGEEFFRSLSMHAEAAAKEATKKPRSSPLLSPTIPPKKITLDDIFGSS